MDRNKDIEMRRLVIKAFHMNQVELGDVFSIEEQKLIVPEDYFSKGLLEDNSYVEKIDVKVIKPNEHEIEVNSIMDIIPISTKVLGRLGEESPIPLPVSML